MSMVAQRGRLFQPTVARLRDGRVYLMNHPEKGWVSYCYPYTSLASLAAAWAVEFGPYGTDEFGLYIEVRPASEVKQ